MDGLPELPPDLPCAPHCKCKRHEQKLQQDHRLAGWRHHQKVSEGTQNYLSRMLLRPRQQLLMSNTERYRQRQEERMLATYAQVPCKFDKYRGNPTWWKTPPALRKVCGEPQVYYVHMSRLERLEVPPLEHVQVSNLYRSLSADPFRGLRKESAFKRLDSFCLKKIQPHRPEVGDVYLVGTAQMPQFSVETFSLSGAAEGTASQNVREMWQASKEFQLKLHGEKHSCIFLEVNEVKISSDSQGSIKISIAFEAIAGESVETHKLYIHNCCSWALRIAFQETNKLTTLAGGEGASRGEMCFFFDRNYRVIVPGEKVDVPLWFCSPKCGLFSQVLAMSVVPDLWNGKVAIEIALNATVKEEAVEGEGSVMSSLRKYEDAIQERVRNRLIGECLKRMLRAIPPKESAVKVFTYDRGTIFESLNSHYDPLHNSSRYIYDKEIVDELEAFYEAVRLDVHPAFWTLSLNDLRVVTKDREAFEKRRALSEDYNHILEVFELNKQMRSEMALKLDQMFAGGTAGGKGKPKKADKPKQKTEKKPKAKVPPKKGKGKKDVARMEEPQRDDIPRTLSDELEAIIAQFQAPIMNVDVRCQRYKVAYNLFCAYMDKIGQEVRDMCRDYFSLERPDPIAARTNAFNVSRMQCEQLSVCNLDARAFFDLPKVRGAPQPQWALEIPMDDYRARFEAMLAERRKGAKSDTHRKGGADKASKGAGRKKEAASSRSKDTKTTGKPKKENAADPAPINGHDEAVEEETVAGDSLSDENWFFLIPPSRLDHYRNNVYVVFYKNLCDLADDLEMAFGMTARDGVHPAEIQRIKFSQQQDLVEDEGLQVECVNLRARISELLTAGAQEALPDHAMGLLPPRHARPPKRTEDLLDTSSSIWDVIKAYLPRRLRKADVAESAPTEEGARDGEGVATPEEAITERRVQTSLCSDIAVTLSEDVFPRDEARPACICGRAVDRGEVAKRVLSFHDSECSQRSAPEPSSSDTCSMDT